MLEIFGSIAGNAVSLPGILGLGMGMLTRKVVLAVIVGGLIGFAEAMIFVQFTFANIHGLELVISVLVGMIAGSIGAAIHRKGVKTA